MTVESTQPNIVFSKSGVEAIWDPECENLLEFAEENGVMVDYSCRAGTCRTCSTKVIFGDVDYPQEPYERPEEGHALLCCSVPKDNLELDV